MNKKINHSNTKLFIHVATYLFVTVLLTRCLGMSTDPVIYISPDASTIYELSNPAPGNRQFELELEFPNGTKPDNLLVVINGVDVTSEFDLQDLGSNFAPQKTNLNSYYMAISGPVNNGNYPEMMKALKDGKNILQVLNPLKENLTFTMDFNSAQIRIGEVVDNYCGSVFINSVGDANDLSNNQITNFDCTDYFYKRCGAIDTNGDFTNEDGSPAFRAYDRTVKAKWDLEEIPLYGAWAPPNRYFSTDSNTTNSNPNKAGTGVVKLNHQGKPIADTMLKAYCDLYESNLLATQSALGLTNPALPLSDSTQANPAWKTTDIATDIGGLPGFEITSKTPYKNSHFKYVRGKIDDVNTYSQIAFRYCNLSITNTPIGCSTGLNVLTGSSATTVDPLVFSASNAAAEVYFGPHATAICNGVPTSLDANEFCGIFPDGFDLYEIGPLGLAPQQWISPHVPLTHSRLGMGGLFRIKIDDGALQNVVDKVIDSIPRNQNLLNENMVTSGCPPTLNDAWNSCLLYKRIISSLQINTPKGSPDFAADIVVGANGKIDVQTLDIMQMPMGSGNGWGLKAMIDTEIECVNQTPVAPPLAGPIANPCGVERGSWDDSGIGLSTVTDLLSDINLTNVSVDLAMSANLVNGKSRVIGDLDTLPNNWNLPTQPIAAMWVGLGPAGATALMTAGADPNCVPFCNVTSAITSNSLQQLFYPSNKLPAIPSRDYPIERMVDDYFNMHLPKLGLAIPGLDQNGVAKKLFVNFHPEVNAITTSLSDPTNQLFPPTNALDMTLGMHPVGSPRLHKSLGLKTNIAAATNLAVPEMFDYTGGATPSLASPAGNVAISMNEMLVNAMMLAFWESGVLYQDFNTGIFPQPLRQLLDNGQIKFASATPWSLDLLHPSVDADANKGDVRINIEDLIIHFSADITNPVTGVATNIVFFDYVADVEVYANLKPSGNGILLEFPLNPDITVKSSNNILNRLGLHINGVDLLSWGMASVLTQLSSTVIPLPAIMGVQVQPLYIWLSDTNNLMMALDLQ